MRVTWIQSIVATLSLAATLSNGQETNSPVELFKQFMENPPAIQEMVFRYRYLNVKYGNSGSIYYLARYQSNALEIMQVKSFDDLSLPTNVPSPRLFLRYDDRWLYMAPNRQVRYWVNEGKEPTNRYNEFLGVFNGAEQDLGDALNFGVANTIPGAIQWRGTNFDAGKNRNGQHIYGSLSRTKDDHPSQLDWTIDINGKNYKWRTTYTFNDQLPAYIPHYILSEASGLHESQFDPEFEVEIDRIKFAKKPLDFSLIPIDKYLTNGPYIYIYTNGELLAKAPNSDKLIPTNGRTEQFEHRARWVLWTMILTSGIALLTIFVLAKKGRK